MASYFNVTASDIKAPYTKLLFQSLLLSKFDFFIRGACKNSNLVFHSSFCKVAAFAGPQMLMSFTRTLATRELHIQAALSVGYVATINSVQGHVFRIYK